MRPMFFACVALGLAACANDPMYVPAPGNLEAGLMDGSGNMIASAKGSLLLPIKTETAADATKRAMEATTLGVDVPYVKVDDIAVEIEYTIKNLDLDNEGTVRVALDGANEFFEYDPTILMLDPGDDEAPPAPSLQGDIPQTIPPGGEVTGTFREDQLEEMSVDLDEVTRGNVSPFRAQQTVDDRDALSFQPLTPLMFDMDGNPLPQDPMGDPIPRAAFPHVIRVDLTLKPSTHMVLDYDVRIRDKRGIVDDKGASAPASELQPFDNIMTFNPTPAM